MSDQRTHLLFQYDDKYDGWDNKLIFPNGKELFIIGIDALETLVQSLVKGNSEFYYHYHCRECDFDHEDLKGRIFNCPFCLQPISSYKTDKRTKDSKLKVTFGSGTWVEVKTIQHVDFKKGTIRLETPDDHHQIIDPLQPIAQLCRELGVEKSYE